MIHDGASEQQLERYARQKSPASATTAAARCWPASRRSKKSCASPAKTDGRLRVHGSRRGRQGAQRPARRRHRHAVSASCCASRACCRWQSPRSPARQWPQQSRPFCGAASARWTLPAHPPARHAGPVRPAAGRSAAGGQRAKREAAHQEHAARRSRPGHGRPYAGRRAERFLAVRFRKSIARRSPPANSPATSTACLSGWPTTPNRASSFNSVSCQAMIYPIILTLMAFGIVTLLLTYVVPKVTGVYDNIDQELPLLTQISDCDQRFHARQRPAADRMRPCLCRSVCAPCSENPDRDAAGIGMLLRTPLVGRHDPRFQHRAIHPHPEYSRRQRRAGA